MAVDGWEETTLEKLSDIRRGASPRPINDPKWFSEEGPGWVRISDITKEKKYLRSTTQNLSAEGVKKSVAVKPGDLIMSICATIGVPRLVDMNACIHDGFVLFENLSSRVDSEYLFYFLHTAMSRYLSMGQPGTQINLNTSIVKDTPIDLPPLLEQKKIAAILNSVDEAIAKTEAVIDQTRRVKQGLLQELLTRGIGHTKFKQTEIGKIPEDWTLEVLNDLSIKITDGTHHSPKTTESGYLYITSKNVRPFELLIDSPLYISEKDHREIYSRCDVKLGDVLLTKDGANTGNCTINPLNEEFSLLSSVGLIRTDPQKLSNQFLCQFLNSEIGRQQSIGSMDGQAIKRITIKKIKAFRIATPPIEEQHEISKILISQDDAINSEKRISSQLQILKKGLMKDLLTGQVRVNTACTNEKAA
jgi:type I restriction enzyme S subunit